MPRVSALWLFRYTAISAPLIAHCLPRNVFHPLQIDPLLLVLQYTNAWCKGLQSKALPIITIPLGKQRRIRSENGKPSRLIAKCVRGDSSAALLLRVVASISACLAFGQGGSRNVSARHRHPCSRNPRCARTAIHQNGKSLGNTIAKRKCSGPSFLALLDFHRIPAMPHAILLKISRSHTTESRIPRKTAPHAHFAMSITRFSEIHRIRRKRRCSRVYPRGNTRSGPSRKGDGGRTANRYYP